MKMPICAPLPQRILAMVCVGLATHGTVALAYTCPAPSTNSLFNLSMCVESEFTSVGIQLAQGCCRADS